ncbi:hypothetical protein T492DRAFT_979582 [Pavlovales sp. CCMP2436]|nr:hypothetical protein T492DRAFT_979582 [Pavlovales sp. CCMP2436]
MRLHVSVAGECPAEVLALRESMSTGRQQLAIAAHETFVGMWSIDGISTDVASSTFVCYVPRYEGAAFSPLPFDIDFDVEGSPNPTIVHVGSRTSRGPSVRIAPTLRLFARATLMMIDQVDTVSQSFRADAAVELRLRGLASYPNEAHVTQLLGQYGMRPDMLDFLNVSEFQMGPERWQVFGKSFVPGLQDYILKIRAKATFLEPFELQNFPFDVQPVGVVVTAQCPVTRVEIVPNLEYVSKFLSTSFALGAVFDLPFGSEVQAKSSTSAPAESSAGLTYSRIAFSVSLSRRHNYFVNNIILPLGSVTLLCPLSAASEPDGSRMGTGDRLAYAVTLMLTAVAYKLVISSSVPQVSYLTKVETYTLVCFGFMWVNLLECALWPAVGYVLVDGVVVERISEWWYALGFVCVFALYNLHFAWQVRSVLAKRVERSA